MKIGIIGYGEVGHALGQVYKKNKKNLANSVYVCSKKICELWKKQQKNTYNKIKLTLSGGFHKIVADELSKMGMNIDVMELQNPLTLLLEKKEKNERKQLNSLNR